MEIVNENKEDMYKALLILTLRDIIIHDNNLSMNRVTSHLNNEYNIKADEKYIQKIIEDAQKIIQ